MVAGLHATGNAGNFADPCRALANGQISGGGPWFAAIYSNISAYLEDVVACTISVTPQTANFSSAGGTGSIQVTTSGTSCARPATSNSGFLTITSGATGTGNGTVGYLVSANTLATSRSGTISVGNQTVTITQAPAATCTAAAIQLGATVTNSINANACSSQRRPNGYARLYTFTANAGQSIAIDMSSTQFDTYLYLIGPSGSVVASDDDGGSDTSSRIPSGSGAFTLPTTGTYTIEATSFLPQATGTFSLTLRLVSACSLQAIAVGQTVNGSLNGADCFSPLGGNFYAERFTFAASAGDAIAITLTSPTMDTWLTLISPNGDLHEDDDSAGNLNSRLPPSGTMTLTQTGTYTIEATTYDTYETGAYTLSLAGTVTTPSGSRLRAVTPCRVMDSRDAFGTFGGPIFTGGSSRTIPIPQSACGIPATAKAYSLNITVVPNGPLSYLTIWPTGSPQPLVSTLNSFEGRVVANAATVPAGTNGSITIFVTNSTHVIVDINGYYE